MIFCVVYGGRKQAALDDPFWLVRVKRGPDRHRRSAMSDSNGSDLVAFLRARLDEEWSALESDSLRLLHSPRRTGKTAVRRRAIDVQSKRRIIDLYEDAWGRNLHSEWGKHNQCGLARAVELLAQPYADHPDFDPDWRI